MTDPGALSVAKVAALIEASAATLKAELGALDEEALAWHPAAGEWCVSEVLGHIIEAEQRGFAGRIRQIVAGRPLQDWDQEEVSANRRDCERGGREILLEFEAARNASLQLLAELTPEQLRLSGIHPEVGELRIVDILHEWVHHDREHVKQILSNVQEYVWPHMGSAQQFFSIK
jgi:hypothetical protein